VLYRDERGYTQAVRAAILQNPPYEAGASLGHLWRKDDSASEILVNQGAPMAGGEVLSVSHLEFLVAGLQWKYFCVNCFLDAGDEMIFKFIPSNARMTDR
jgi:hypothetical protein